jgi:hypothetical protein
MIVLSQQTLDYANGVFVDYFSIFLHIYIYLSLFRLYPVELRQAARDLHRIQTRYEPSVTTQQNNNNNNNTECPTAEQTRYLSWKQTCSYVRFLFLF